MTVISWWTVAHSAAEHGFLPTSFSQWDLTDRYRIRISDTGEAKEQHAQWRIISGFSCTEDVPHISCRQGKYE
jgi:hypothetical protein